MAGCGQKSASPLGLSLNEQGGGFEWELRVAVHKLKVIGQDQAGERKEKMLKMQVAPTMLQKIKDDC